MLCFAVVHEIERGNLDGLLSWYSISRIHGLNNKSRPSVQPPENFLGWLELNLTDVPFVIDLSGRFNCKKLFHHNEIIKLQRWCCS